MSDNAIQQSVRYIQAGDLDRAEETVRQLLRDNTQHIQGWCLLGLIRQARGKLDEALSLFQEAIRLDPDSVDAYNHLGGALVQLRQPDQAIVYLEEALRLHPFYPEAYNNLGKAYVLLQRGDEALGCFREALHLQPHFVEALNNLALLHIGRREFDEARPLLERVVQAEPKSPGGPLSLSALYFEQGELEQALTAVRQAVQLDPQLPVAQGQLGAVLLKMGRFEEAVGPLQAVLQATPDSGQATEHLGVTLMALGRREEALVLLRRAVELDPANIRVLSNLLAGLVELRLWQEIVQVASLAVRRQVHSAKLLFHLGLAHLHLKQPEQALAVLKQSAQLQPESVETFCALGWGHLETGRFELAAQTLREALRLQPAYAPALYNLGLAYDRLGKIDEARDSFEQVLRAQANSAEALAGLGNAYKNLGLQDEAIASFRQSLALNPYQVDTHSALVFNLHYSPSATPEEIFQEHLHWVRRHTVAPSDLGPPHANERDPERRLRIGYVSADFCGHVPANYIEPLLQAHNRERFEVFCYSNVKRADSKTQRLETLADHWRNIFDVADGQVEQTIRRDQIDVLVDLSGHTGGSRLPVFARKPAPVQATHFGYMNTTGLSAMDYRITDAFCDPPGMTERYHTEQLMRLPDTLWCYQPDTLLEVNPLPAASHGQVTFGMFNNFPKVTPQAIAAWAQILNRLPGSRLLLVANVSPSADQRLRDAFLSHGIDANRLMLLGRQHGDDYFRLYQRVDLTLDPFPYTGLYTTADSLWMGVPVVTRIGSTCVTRQAASILAQVGLEDLSAPTTEDYVEMAVRLAKDLPRLTELRANLRQRMSQSPLMNPPRFTRQLEEAYRWMWRQWCLTSPLRMPV